MPSRIIVSAVFRPHPHLGPGVGPSRRAQPRRDRLDRQEGALILDLVRGLKERGEVSVIIIRDGRAQPSGASSRMIDGDVLGGGIRASRRP